MGLFSRKPSRGLAAELTRQATIAMAFFAYALKHKKSMPRDKWPDEGPEFASRGDIIVVGLAQPFRKSEALDRPSVWRRFEANIERIPDRVGAHTLGINEVADMAAGDMVYAPAVEVSEFGDLPDELFGKVLDGGRFAIFSFSLSGEVSIWVPVA